LPGFPGNLGTPTRLTVLGSTITHNEARGGAAGTGGRSAGLGAGGGLSSAGILAVLDSIFAHNASRGDDGEDSANASRGDDGEEEYGLIPQIVEH
jgi:hypothetical protein